MSSGLRRARALVLCSLLSAPWTVGISGCGPDDGQPTDGEAADDRGSCETGSPAALMTCVDPARYDADLSFVAAVRSPGSVHHRAVRERCAKRLSELGYSVELHDYGSGVNVIGLLPGGSLREERVLISAHYDHSSGCSGADDNGSGVAGLLELARILAQASYERTLVLAFWDEEERGLIGSSEYAMRAASRDEPIVANFVFEMIGVYKSQPNTQKFPVGFELLFPEQIADLEAKGFRGDFLALVFDERHSQSHVEAMSEFGARVGLETVQLGLSDDLKNSDLVPDLRRSDHAPFWMLHYPGVMITDTAAFRYPEYHCREGDDVVENLDTGFAVRTLQATLGAAVQLLELR